MLGGVAFASIWSGALDARPRRWRLRSSVALDAAAALVELAALPAFPQYFVPIAGLANVAKNISYLAASASRVPRSIAHYQIGKAPPTRVTLPQKVRLPDHRGFVSWPRPGRRRVQRVRRRRRPCGRPGRRSRPRI